MYIIIVGGGSVGYYLCQALLREGHEVLVLDKDTAKCERFGDEFGGVCIRGDGCEVATLADAGVARADVFIATTNEDEDNLVSCQVARHKFNVPRTIARVNNPKNEEIFKKLGVDCTIGVTNLILRHIEEELPAHPLTHLLTMAEAGTEIVEIKIEQKSIAIGKTIKDLKLPKDAILALLIRNGEKPVVPTQDIVLKLDDRILALTSLKSEEELYKVFASGSTKK
jgi:trk system potassium uptake protein TrkA